MNLEDVEQLSESLRRLVAENADLRKRLGIVSKQYGIASETIFHLKGETALLRAERNEVLEELTRSDAELRALKTQLTEMAQKATELEDKAFPAFEVATAVPREPRTFRLGDPEPLDRETLTLIPATPYYNGELFVLRFGAFNEWQQSTRGPQWWSFIDGIQYTHASWNYWLNNYGPLTEVLEG